MITQVMKRRKMGVCRLLSAFFVTNATLSLALVTYWPPRTVLYRQFHVLDQAYGTGRTGILLLQQSSKPTQQPSRQKIRNETIPPQSKTNDFENEKVQLLPNFALGRRRMLKLSAPILATGLANMDPDGPRIPIAEAQTPTKEVPSSDIPFSLTRRYKKIALRNGLSVLLVSDKSVSVCQAAMSVPAGQFYDGSIPGLAHLMEHMVLSTPVVTSTNRNRGTDLESWLSEREGASNAFTANQKVCYHLTCPKQVFSETLERFATVFRQRAVEAVCRDRNILRREIRRVDSELNFESVYAQEEYLTKAFVNLEHPYSKFSKGSLESLEQVPLRQHIDVGDRLVAFFRRYYVPQRSFLVIVGPQDLSYLERWAIPFSDTLVVKEVTPDATTPLIKAYFPGQFLVGSRQYKQLILKRNLQDDIPPNIERLTLQWVINLDYRNTEKLITINEVMFVLSQILCRRGPGSLYLYLLRRGWIPETNINTIPKFSVPVDVSGFQIIKMELGLTKDGFANRAEILNAVYASINSLRSNRRGKPTLSRDLMLQYGSVAKLFGYYLAPRPPDAIELAFDALVYNQASVCSGTWYRFPSSIKSIRKVVCETLEWMGDPDNALVIVTASEKMLRTMRVVVGDDQWLVEPISGAKFIFDENARQRSLSRNLVSEIVGQQELLPPFFNPLVPNLYEEKNRLTKNRVMSDQTDEIPRGWVLVRLRDGMFIPRQPVDSSYGRCALVLQFLSPKPARANVRQAARGELWKQTFEIFAAELAELGSPGGLAYDMSFNKFGIRFSFLGVNQTLPSYIRRMIRRLLEHQQLLQYEKYPVNIARVRVSAISSAKTARGLSPARRARIISNLRSSSREDVCREGRALLESITGVVAISQGEIEADVGILSDVNTILSDGGIDVKSFASSGPLLNLEELYYRPSWKPRFASGCYVAGINFISDSCGRIPR